MPELVKTPKGYVRVCTCPRCGNPNAPAGKHFHEDRYYLAAHLDPRSPERMCTGNPGKVIMGPWSMVKESAVSDVKAIQKSADVYPDLSNTPHPYASSFKTAWIFLTFGAVALAPLALFVIWVLPLCGVLAGIGYITMLKGIDIHTEQLSDARSRWFVEYGAKELAKNQPKNILDLSQD